MRWCRLMDALRLFRDMMKALHRNLSLFDVSSYLKKISFSRKIKRIKFISRIKMHFRIKMICKALEKFSCAWNRKIFFQLIPFRAEIAFWNSVESFARVQYKFQLMSRTFRLFVFSLPPLYLVFFSFPFGIFEDTPKKARLHWIM